MSDLECNGFNGFLGWFVRVEAFSESLPPWSKRHSSGAVWCSVVQCGVAWCSVVQCGAVWCSVVQCGAVWCGVVQCGAISRCCNHRLQFSPGHLGARRAVVLQCGVVWYHVLQRVEKKRIL